jgi:hypothetical protein
MTFTKGSSGNPGGRPRKGRSLSDLLETALAEKGADGLPKRKALMQVLVNMGLSGDLDAIKVLLDRVDGKVIDRQEITGRDGQPIEFNNAGLSDTERAARVDAIFERARQTRARLLGTGADMDAAPGPTDTGVQL